MQRPMPRISQAWRGTSLAPALRTNRRNTHARGHRLVQPLCFINLDALRNAHIVSSLSSLDEELQQPSSSTPTDRDAFKEDSRKFFRIVFDFDRWAAHRSTSRYARHMLGMPRSRTVRGLAQPLLYVLGIATTVVLYESAREAGVLPAMFPDLILHSREPFGLTSFALSLLLVFRTNASYSRWLDARKTWGRVLNHSRDIVRQGLAMIPPEKAPLRDMLCRWTPAFSLTLMCHLRQDGDVERELRGLLLQHELDSVMLAEHRPNYVLQVLSEIVYSAHVWQPAALHMDENITEFEECLGTCERILNTPIPLSYTRHTSRFMMIWLTLLPFTLYDACHAASIPLCGVIAFLLLGIEEIGVSIEEPFSILALEAFCDTALRNVRELHATHTLGAGSGGSRHGDGSPRPLPAAQLVALSTATEVEEVGVAAWPGASALALPQDMDEGGRHEGGNEAMAGDMDTDGGGMRE